MEELKLNKRINERCNEARKIRREGKVPGVIYGKKIGNLMFQVEKTALEKELAVSGDYGVLSFDLDGEKGTAVIKEVQKSPVSNKVIHLDLEAVDKNEKMETEVLINFIGKELLESKGEILQIQKDLVKVSCKPEDLPKSIDFDVTAGEVGKVYTFKDLKFSGEVTVVDELSTVIGSVIEKEGMIEDSDSDSSEE